MEKRWRLESQSPYKRLSYLQYARCGFCDWSELYQTPGMLKEWIRTYLWSLNLSKVKALQRYCLGRATALLSSYDLALILWRFIELREWPELTWKNKRVISYLNGASKTSSQERMNDFGKRQRSAAGSHLDLENSRVHAGEVDSRDMVSPPPISVFDFVYYIILS